MRQTAFRLTEDQLAALDRVVAWYRTRAPASFAAYVTRASVVRALIEQADKARVAATEGLS